METFEGIVLELEAVAECDSVEEVYERLEEHEVVLRIDRSVVPTMMKGATLSIGELELLRQVENVVRLGHVERIDRDEIVLEHGTDPDESRSSARALRDARAERPPARADLHRRHDHAPGGVARQLVHVGGAASASSRRAGGRPPRRTVCAARTRGRRRRSTSCARSSSGSRPSWPGRTPTSRRGSNASRLNLVGGLVDHPDQEAVRALQGRFLAALFPALDNLEQLAAQASDAERARIFEPADG